MSVRVRKLVEFIVATPAVKRDRLNMRAWFAAFCMYLAALAVVSLGAFDRYSDTGSDWGRAVWLFGLYLFYFSLACTFVPIPTSWFILFLASPVGGLPLGALWRVMVVAALGALATGVSHVNEYHVISYLLRLGRIHRVKETRIYQWSERQFVISPFLLQVAFNVIPAPADPVRWLAAIYGYPLGRFFLAHSLGRFIRYSLMALAAEVLELTLWQIAAIQCAIVAIAFSRMAVKWTFRAAVRSDKGAGELVKEPVG